MSVMLIATVLKNTDQCELAIATLAATKIASATSQIAAALCFSMRA